MRKQVGLLAALVAVFVAVMLVVSRGEGPTDTQGAPSNSAGRSGGPQAPAAVADVKLELLQQQHEQAPQEPTRNLFAFRARPAPPPPPERDIDPGPTATAPPVPSGPPPPPPILLKFIGVMERAGQAKVAILSDGRGNTFHAREGEDIDGRYRVLKIGTESVELSYVDGRGRQTLRLSGQ